MEGEGNVRAWINRYLDSVNSKPKSREVLNDFIRDEHLFEHIQVFERAFPRYQLKAEDVLVDGDRVAVRFTLHGTHMGELHGMAPTGKTVQVPGIIIYRLQDDHIVEHWMQTDVPALMAQLTTLPEAAPV